ncbi:MAG: response regulator [Williamsia sp.]|nr:response regulator [Williamsia sp.]
MKKILLIEDNDQLRENTAEILELSNYKVYTAPDGKQGVEQAIKQQPDLVICDIMMPVLDGYGVLHMLRKNASLQNTPFIFLTAKSERADFRKGMESGADDYITKPFNGTELLQAVEGRLKKIELLQKEYSPGIEGLDQLQQTAGVHDLVSLTQERSTHRYKKKQAIYLEGNHPVRLFYILKGKVKTYKTNEDGKDLVVGVYREGDFFGYIPLIDGTLYKDNAEAMEDADIALIPRKEFEELMNNNREVAQKFIRMLAKNVAEKEEQLLSIAYSSLRKKVAGTLITLQKKYTTSAGQPVSIDISRETLATMAGTATESTIRTLSDFKNDGLIDIKEGSIIILNQKKLERMIN